MPLTNPFLTLMYLLIIALPLLGALFAGFGGRWLGGAGASRVTTVGVATSFLLSLVVFYEVALSHSPVLIRLNP